MDAYNLVVATDPRIAPENYWKLGQNLSLTPITLGAWHHVVVHLDTGGSTGLYEAWIDGEKVAEWRPETTGDFTFDIPPAFQGGHERMRLLTTVDDDVTVMFDNFAMCGE